MKLFVTWQRETHLQMRTSVFASRRAGAELTEWGVKKSISDEGEKGKERKVAPEYYRARVRSETAAAVT